MRGNDEMKKNDFLKLLAVMAMTIDHLGALIFTDFIILRLIGRIAFPIFAYETAVGFEHTSNIYKYMLRLIIFSIVSQPIYDIAFRAGSLNIGFTMLYGVVVLYFWNREKLRYKAIATILIIGSVAFSQLEYGWYGVVMIFLFHLYRLKPKYSNYSQIVLNVVSILFGGFILQGFAVFALPFIHKKWEVNVVLPKYFFYVYYPAHLIVITIIMYAIR